MRMMFQVAAVVSGAALLACSSLEPPPADDHVVAAPISRRATVVLSNVVSECGSTEGMWRWSLSPGCAAVWATQFGYRAGLRREREDILAIGETTAGRVSADLRGVAWDALFGTVDPEDPALAAFPALLASGALGRRKLDGVLFVRGLALLEDPSVRLRPSERAGAAALLAEVARLDPDAATERLDRARELAGDVRSEGDGTWRFLAWAAIARASGRAADVARARDALAATSYRFDREDGGLAGVTVDPAHEILSRHLAMIHGLADLAQATGDPTSRDHALALLEYVFSDAYFDGRFLVHDRRSGERSEEVCAGCNFMALYLADRLYGDSFAIGPVPSLPERDAAWVERATPKAKSFDRRRGDEHRLVLTPGEDGRPGTAVKKVAPLSPDGRVERVVFIHQPTGATAWLESTVLPPSESAPRGAVRLRFAHHRSASKYRMTVAFDEQGVARLAPRGFEPLAFSAAFQKNPDGTVTGVFWTGESWEERSDAPLPGRASSRE